MKLHKILRTFMLSLFKSDARLKSYYMHEVRGFFCKTIIPRLISKTQRPEKNGMGRNWQAQRCTGEAGAAHHWALAQLVEREGLHGAQLGLLVLRSVNVRARRAGELLLFVSK